MKTFDKALPSLSRRGFMTAAVAAGAYGIAPRFVGISASAAGTKVKMQLGWLASGNNLGEVVAKRLGYYEKEGLDLVIDPGGPSIDGVAMVAAGQENVGQVSSSPSIMLAVAQGIPIKCFAVGAQRHPYTFFSLAKKPVKTPQDLIGKKVGIQATGQVLLSALLAQAKVDPAKVEVVIIGAEMTPILTGQVDVVTGWTTNVTALAPLGKDRVDLALWDSGVKLYALPYYALTSTIEKQGEHLAAFLRATGKGWEYASANKDEAVKMLVTEYPNLDYKDERAAADVMLSYAFDAKTKAEGWGTMDPAVWQSQIDQYAALKQFDKRVPKVEEVMTLDILKASANGRPKLG